MKTWDTAHVTNPSQCKKVSTLQTYDVDCTNTYANLPLSTSGKTGRSAQ